MRTPSSPRTLRSRGLAILVPLALPVVLATAACGSTSPPQRTAAAATSETQPSNASGTSSRPASLAGGDWTGFRGDASRSAVGLNGPTGNPILNWQFRAGGAVPNNLAIVGESVYFVSDEGTLHAVALANGKEQWKRTLKAGSPAGPVVADGRVYLSDLQGAIEAFEPATGSQLWMSPTTYDGPSQMVTMDGSLYLGTGDGYLVAVDATTGAEQWKLQLTPTGAAVHNPAAADGMVYAGTAGGGFVAVDAKTHAVAWTGDLNGDDTGTAVVHAGVAYIATSVDAPSGALHAFDAKTGAALWDGPTPLLQSPTIFDQIAFSATSKGRVDAIDTATGTLRWSIQLTGKIRPMAVVGPTLYLAADEEHRVYAVEAATGNRLWQFDVDGGNDCCIAVAKGAVFVGTLSGSVYSIGGDGATIAAKPFGSAAPAESPAPPPATFAELKVTVSWTTELRRLGFAPFGQMAIEPKTGRIWTPEANNNKFAILDSAGRIIEEWGAPGADPFDFTRQNGDGYGTLVFEKDGSFYVLDVGNRRVQHFSARRTLLGTLGEFGNGPGQYTDPVGIAVAADGSVWILDDQRGVVEHYDATGKVLGSFDPFATLSSNDGANSLAIDRTGNLYVTSVEPSQVVVFDSTGKFLRTVGEGLFGEQAGLMAIDAHGRLFVTQGSERGSAPGVLVFAADGTPLGAFGPIGAGDGQVVFPGALALDGTGGVYVEDSVPESARMIRFALPASLR